MPALLPACCTDLRCIRMYTPAAATWRQRVSQMVAEAQEAAEIESGLRETIAQANSEKAATAEELTSCRGELSKAIRESAGDGCCSVGAGAKGSRSLHPARGSW